MNELVSIIMPAYNCEDYIGETLESVINQTYVNWELLIVDDCSTDSTLEIIKGFAKKDTRINFYQMDKNSGAAMARNKAVEISVGDYIAFLDSDDLWKENKLEKQISFMIQNNYFFTCTYYDKIDENSKHLPITVEYYAVTNYKRLLKNAPGNSTVLYNQKKLGKFFIPDIRKRNDYVMWLQIIKKSSFLYCLDETLSSHRIRAGSLSSDKKSLAKYHWYIYKNIESLGYMQSFCYCMYWIFKGIRKKIIN